MQLLDHVSITVPRLDEARPFYDAVMDALGASKVYDREDALGYGERCRAGDAGHTYLSVFASPQAGSDARRHWCFRRPAEAPWTASMPPAWRMAAAMTARPACARTTTRITTPPSCSTPAAIASRPSATTLSDARGAQIRLER